MARGQLISSGISEDLEFSIVSTESLKRKTVRVLFTDAPKAVSPNESDDGLNPSNWLIVPRSDLIPSDEIKAYTTVVVVGVSIVEDDPLSLDVLVDEDFTFGMTYKITMSSAVVRANDIGGWTLPAVLTSDFLSFDPACRNKPMPSVFDWFGSAVRKCDVSGDTERFAAVIQDMFEQMKFLSDCMVELFDPLVCPEDFLDARLEALGNPFDLFTSEMNLDEKRLIALNLVSLYRLKGTEAGILAGLEQMLGLQNVGVIALNLRGWRLASPTGETIDRVYRLGERRWESSASHPLPPHFQGPLNPEFTPNEVTVGNSFLGAHTPSYIHSGLSSSSYPGRKKQTRMIRLGTRWNLSEIATKRPPEKPDDAASGYVPTEEKGRKEIYSYRIVIDQILSAVQIARVRFVCEYMQPASMHLQAIVTAADKPNSNRLGSARLNNDFRLR